MKKIIGLVLCLGLLISILPLGAVAEEVAIPYSTHKQSTLENVAAGKMVFTSSCYKSQTEERTGKYLTDEILATGWESGSNGGTYAAGEHAIVDLGLQHCIKWIEVKSADETGRKNFKIYGSSDNTNWILLHERGAEPFPADSCEKVVCYGEKFQYIKLEKTTAEKGYFSEIRVFADEPNLIEVTPKLPANYDINDPLSYKSAVWCNGSMPSGTNYCAAKLIDNDISVAGNPTFSEYRKPANDQVRFTFDLGSEYKVKRVQILARGGDINAPGFPARRHFEVWTGNTSSIEGDICANDKGHLINKTTWNEASATGQYAAGGQTLLLDTDYDVPTRYVTVKQSDWWGIGAFQDFTLKEVKIYAEKETVQDIDIINVSNGKSIVSQGSATQGCIIDNNEQTSWIADDESQRNVTIDLGDYYNVRKIDVVPDDAYPSSKSYFRVIGTATPKLGRDETVLATQDSNQINALTSYDVKTQNMVRYITYQAKAGTGTVGVKEIKVYAEAGKKYDNIALGQKSGSPSYGGGVEIYDGAINNNNLDDMVYGNLWGPTTQKGNIMYIDLGSPKKIDGYTLIARDIIDKSNERNVIDFYGANNSDFSDAVLLGAQGARPYVSGGGMTKLVEDNNKYRYIVIDGNIQGKNTLGAKYNGEQENYEAPQVEKVFSEVMVFTQKKDIADISKNSSVNPFLTDRNTQTTVALQQEVIELEKYYPISVIETDRNATSDISVYGSNDDLNYALIGTISAGSSILDLNNSAYKFIKFTATTATTIGEIYVYTPTKFAGKELVTENCVFNNSLDGSGTVITDLNSPILGVKAVVRNISATPKSSTVILGLFDQNNVLIDIAVSDAKTIASASVENISTGITRKEILSAGCTLKVFVWESLSDLNPISKSERIKQ